MIGVEDWLMWLILTAIIAIGKILSKKSFLTGLAIRAALAGLMAFIGFATLLQWALFIVISGALVLFFGWRRIKAEEKVKKKQPKTSKKSICPACRNERISNL